MSSVTVRLNCEQTVKEIKISDFMTVCIMRKKLRTASMRKKKKGEKKRKMSSAIHFLFITKSTPWRLFFFEFPVTIRPCRWPGEVITWLPARRRKNLKTRTCLLVTICRAVCFSLSIRFPFFFFFSQHILSTCPHLHLWSTVPGPSVSVNPWRHVKCVIAEWTIFTSQKVHKKK